MNRVSFAFIEGNVTQTGAYKTDAAPSFFPFSFKFRGEANWWTRHHCHDRWHYVSHLDADGLQTFLDRYPARCDEANKKELWGALWIKRISRLFCYSNGERNITITALMAVFGRRKRGPAGGSQKRSLMSTMSWSSAMKLGHDLQDATTFIGSVALTHLAVHNDISF